LAALGLAGAIGHERVRLIADPLRFRAGRVRTEQLKDDILNISKDVRFFVFFLQKRGWLKIKI
jgi:hypothetical protein